MNDCKFTGRHVRDPEFREFEGADGTTKRVVRFTLAVDRKFKNSAGEWESDPSFLDFEAWDSAAALIAGRYRKGDFMFVRRASIKTDRWVDKKTKEKRSKLCFRCDDFELLPLLNSRRQEQEQEAAPADKGGKPVPARRDADDTDEEDDICF